MLANEFVLTREKHLGDRNLEHFIEMLIVYLLCI